LLVEVSGDACRVGDGNAGVGVVDDGEGVKRGSVVTGGGGEGTDFLAGWFDVGVLDPFCGEWDALVVEGVSKLDGG